MVEEGENWVGSIERFGIFSRVSGYDNLDFFNALKGGDKSDLQRIVEEWQPLEPFLKCLQQPYYLCSTGMKHLLAIARAFVCSAEIVLLDEPMRSLDDGIANFLWEWISRQRITVIIASHQKSSCGERYTCYCLDKGKLWPY